MENMIFRYRIIISQFYGLLRKVEENCYFSLKNYSVP